MNGRVPNPKETFLIGFAAVICCADASGNTRRTMPARSRRAGSGASRAVRVRGRRSRRGAQEEAACAATPDASRVASQQAERGKLWSGLFVSPGQRRLPSACPNSELRMLLFRPTARFMPTLSPNRQIDSNPRLILVLSVAGRVERPGQRQRRQSSNQQSWPRFEPKGAPKLRHVTDGETTSSHSTTSCGTGLRS
jgi:hypothetical protein